MTDEVDYDAEIDRLNRLRVQLATDSQNHLDKWAAERARSAKLLEHMRHVNSVLNGHRHLYILWCRTVTAIAEYEAGK